MNKILDKVKRMFGRKPRAHIPWRIYDGFDEEEVFEKDILPFIKRAAELCKQHKIPYLFWTIPLCITDGKGNARGKGYTDMWTDRQIARRMRLFGAAASGLCSEVDFVNGLMRCLQENSNRKNKEGEAR